ncbi:hypothetical protein F2Q69_00048781 [Brassica cretica]|uniref:Uncharacterized protein n=1 Tax=Brassica cretica TaxID=69181 RepID=A0A8S9PRT1_BRACR|nr:hypothetical protein F2Q69_00048781 [Brassica cretica]
MEIQNWDPGNRSGVGDSHRIDHYYLESFEGIRRGYEDFGRKIRSDLGKDLNRKGKLGFKGYWGLMGDLYRISLRDQRPIMFQSKDIRGMRIGSAERLISISRWLGAVKGKGIEGRLRMIMIIGVGISIFVIIKANIYFSYTDKPFLEGISERQRWLGSVAIMVWSTKDLVWSSTWHRGRLFQNGAGDAASIRRQEDCLVYRDDTRAARELQGLALLLTLICTRFWNGLELGIRERALWLISLNQSQRAEGDVNIEMARKRGNKMETGEAGSFIGRRVIDILPRNSSLRSLIQSHQTSRSRGFWDELYGWRETESSRLTYFKDHVLGYEVVWIGGHVVLMFRLV